MENRFNERLMQESFPDILGQDSAKRQLASALLMKHHIIIVGPPGIGKTTLAKNVAKLLPEITVNDCSYHCNPDSPVCPECRTKDVKKRKVSGMERFVRIQGSQDLTVEDILGDIDPAKALEFGPTSMEAFTPGKIFKANQGVLFFDELNRCPEKLQNSLLQVLEEGYATLGSYTVDIPADFIFIGTMNPEDSSTETLSDVLLDRFDVVYMGYPDSDETEKRIVLEKGKRLDVDLPDDMLDLTIEFVRDLRSSEKLERLPSVRATLSLYERMQANAVLSKSPKVRFKDMWDAVISVLSHRISFKPSIKYMADPVEFLENELQSFAKKHKEKIEKGGDP